jgi:antirestriction protein
MEGDKLQETTPEEAAEVQPEPRIYVASLSDYNAGRLHGVWLDVTADTEELQDGVAAMLAASPEPGAEEWAIHDYEGFGGVRLDEYESLDAVSRLAAGLADHGPAFAAWADIAGRDEETLERFEEAYLGQWDSLAAYAEELFEDLGYADLLDQAMPAGMQPYVRFDAEAFGRDLYLGGDVSYAVAPDGGVWVFDNRQ